MVYFDFVGSLRILKYKGYELTLYPGEKDHAIYRNEKTNWIYPVKEREIKNG